MQFAGNISKDDKQYIPRATTWRSTRKLHGWLCDTCQNKKYNFDTEEISILGVVVGKEEVQIENDKIKVVKE